MRTIEKTIFDLCDEIDSLKDDVLYWKEMYENERNESNRLLNERMEDTKTGIANALMFALSVKDNPDGSLSINKEDRKMLASRYK